MAPSLHMRCRSWGHPPHQFKTSSQCARVDENAATERSHPWSRQQDRTPLLGLNWPCSPQRSTNGKTRLGSFGMMGRTNLRRPLIVSVVATIKEKLGPSSETALARHGRKERLSDRRRMGSTNFKVRGRELHSLGWRGRTMLRITN